MTESLNCFVLTYNCGRVPVKPDVLGHYISQTLKGLPKHEIIVLSLQEIAPLAYGYTGILSHYYGALDAAIKIATGDGEYVNIFTRNLGLTASLVYVHQSYKPQVASVEAAATGVGVSETGNKGAVGTRLGWSCPSGKYIDLTFIAAHLAPHEHNTNRRNEDWKHIVQRLNFESVWTSCHRLESKDQIAGLTESRETILDESAPLLNGNEAEYQREVSPSAIRAKSSTIYSPRSYVFVAGDLNYRTSDCSPTPEGGDFTIDATLLKRDQLQIEIAASRTLHGFREAAIKFNPTYKYSSKRQKEMEQIEQRGFDSSNAPPVASGYALHRWPSWCDRVLFQSPFAVYEGPKAEIINNLYTSLPLISTSDHQPVVASFTLFLNRHSSNSKPEDHRTLAPYPVDPNWRQRYTMARRKEFLIGIAALFTTTWPGYAALFTAFVSVVIGVGYAKGYLF